MNAPQKRALEGHFACGAGLLIKAECLGRSYTTRTATRDLTVMLPSMPKDWQGDGELNPPGWSFKTFRDPDQETRLSDSSFKWGLCSGFKNNDDGTQSPEFARVNRWGFQTTIAIGTENFAFFNARGEAMHEIAAWWDLVSSWISIVTRQDFVDIGKTRSGIRVGPVIAWCGDENDLRVNGSRETSITVTNDIGVDRIGESALRKCLDLAGSGTQPPDEWLFIRDARSLVNAEQYRRAVIDACTAAELSLTARIDAQFNKNGTNAADREKEFKSHHGISRLKALHKKVGAPESLPKRLVEDVGSIRNKAAHKGYVPTLTETTLAIQIAATVVELVYPLATFGF